MLPRLPGKLLLVPRLDEDAESTDNAALLRRQLDLDVYLRALLAMPQWHVTDYRASHHFRALHADALSVATRAGTTLPRMAGAAALRPEAQPWTF